MMHDALILCNIKNDELAFVVFHKVQGCSSSSKTEVLFLYHIVTVSVLDPCPQARCDLFRNKHTITLCDYI